MDRPEVLIFVGTGMDIGVNMIELNRLARQTRLAADVAANCRPEPCPVQNRHLRHSIRLLDVPKQTVNRHLPGDRLGHVRACSKLSSRAMILSAWLV